MMENADEARRESRKEELLVLARRSRTKWVLDALPQSYFKNQQVKIISNNNNDVLQERQSHKNRSPIVMCIQEILDLLSELIDDGVLYDIDSTYLTDNDITSIDISNNNNDSKNDSYISFLNKLCNPKAFEIVNSIQHNILKFETIIREEKENSISLNNDDNILLLSDKIYKYNDFLFDLIINNPLWKDNINDNNKEIVKEFCERFLFTKLHSYIFAIDNEDIYHNQRLKERIKSLKFLTFDHLDIKLSNDIILTKSLVDILEIPINHLNKLEYCRCQYDILECLKLTDTSILEILRPNSNNSNKYDLPGADETLSMIILVLTNCELTQLYSLRKYIHRFFHSSKLVSRSGYLLTQFLSAIEFLETVDVKKLTISPEEYERSIRLCKQQYIDTYERNNNRNIKNQLNNDVNDIDININIIDIEKTIDDILSDKFTYPKVDNISLFDSYKLL